MAGSSVAERQQWLEALVALAREAGDVIMRVYATDFAVHHKDDESPVTEADAQAEAVILAGLARCAPGVAVVAEEQVSAGRVPEVADRFFLVDPLDGTKEFIRRNGEFTVNIALVEQGRPVLGVIGAPALGRLYAGALGLGAWCETTAAAGAAPLRRALSARAAPADGLTVVSSRSHLDEAALQRFLAGRRLAARTAVGSSLKLCLIAAGEADLYPRHGRTMEWDIAAGDAILRAAGGEVRVLVDHHRVGEPLSYGKPGFENPDFVAYGRASTATGR